jgi:hypothetical protein
MSVSIIRRIAAVRVSSYKMSMALIGTSSMWIPSRSHMADGQAGGDQDRKAPPGETDHDRECQSHENTGYHAHDRCNALQCVADRLIHRDLDDK